MGETIQCDDWDEARPLRISRKSTIAFLCIPTCHTEQRNRWFSLAFKSKPQPHLRLCSRPPAAASPPSLSPPPRVSTVPGGTFCFPPTCRPLSSPFLSVNSQYLETLSILDLHCLHLAGSQKHSLPDNWQLHSPTNKRGPQESRNKVYSQQGQYTKAKPGISS